MTSAQVRGKLVEALQLDLVGPGPGLGNPSEVLPQSPSRWYLTGFLAPLDAAPEQRATVDADDELSSAGESGMDDDITPEPAAAAKQRYFPSSIGLSVLLPRDAKTLKVRVRWGDYRRQGDDRAETWRRTAIEEEVEITAPQRLDRPHEYKVPRSDGLRIALMVQPVGQFDPQSGLPEGARTVSVFLVNRRTPKELDSIKDEAFAFQTALEVRADAPFVPRPDARGLVSDDWDESVADLQYRDVGEYAVGHNVAADGDAQCVRTCWVPEGLVERVAPAELAGVTLRMEDLANLRDGEDARAKLMPLAEQYRQWIRRQANLVPDSPAKRRNTGADLLNRANAAADRIARGVELLAQADCLKAFQTANRTMAVAARQRFGPMRGKPAESVGAPEWRPFQLAFLLMNLPGIAEPESDDRTVVDLLFFPTGGGKTEAYLGLAAFTLVLRRLRNPGVTGAGVSVLMRYTLRLLTLDQLSRAATLICALELEREKAAELGHWPFEIGLWVGRKATPNEMGSKDHDHPETARRRTITFWNDERRPSPIPLEECPWCGAKFQQKSFRLTASGRPNRDYPTDLQIGCVSRDCEFNRDRALPIIAVDEPLYRRLPCFLIARGC